MSDLLDFTENAGCQKCGSKSITTTYKPPQWSSRQSGNEPPAAPEHLHRDCRDCGFGWNTKTKSQTIANN